MLLSACGIPHGQPSEGSEPVAPDQILEFGTLYGQNCSGCHGVNGKGGPAIALADPVYLAVADDAAIRKAVADGVSGTSMPAIAQSAGGMLTDKQIDVISGEIRARWSKPGVLIRTTSPSYAAKSTGDAQRGEAAFKVYCESCHGPSRRGGQKASAIADECFLALVLDQRLVSIVNPTHPALRSTLLKSKARRKHISGHEIT